MERFQILERNAEKMYSWITTREGFNVWDSANLSDPGKTMSMPVIDQYGNRDKKPSWDADKIIRTIKDVSECEVIQAKEVKRFRVGVRMGGNGLSLKVTDGGSRNIKKALAKYENSWYEFDYYSQEAVIFVPGGTIPLEDWVKKNITTPQSI